MPRFHIEGDMYQSVEEADTPEEAVQVWAAEALSDSGRVSVHRLEDEGFFHIERGPAKVTRLSDTDVVASRGN